MKGKTPLDAEAIRALLDLAPHPEGGHFRETFRAEGDARATSTAIYFLLEAGTFSAFHRIRADEVWHFYDGDPLELTVIDGGVASRTELGRDLARGQRPQSVVRGGAWQAAMPLLGGEHGYTLCGCTVAPGFEFAEFEMPSQRELLALLPDHADLVRRLSRGT